jgi:hypothetical protein
MYRLTILLAVAVALVVGIGQAGAKNKRAYVAGHFLLEVDRATAGALRSAAGGACTADVISEGLSRDGLSKKHVGGVKYEDLSINCSTGMSKAFYSWIKDSFDHKYSRKNGAIIAADYDYKERSRREFQNALITEIGFPALDGASKEPAYMVLKLTPESVSYLAGTGQQVDSKVGTQKKWLPANFRLRIDGLEDACKRVNKVEALTIKQKVSEGGDGGLVVLPDLPPLLITLPELDAKPFYDWHESFVIKGNNGDDQEKGGTLEYLAQDLQEVLFTLTFKNLGIFKVAPERSEAGSESIQRVKAEMYCEDIRFDYSAAAASP